MHPHRVALARGETEQAEAVAGGPQRLGKQEQAVADHVDDAPLVVHPGIGRQRQVRHQRAHQVARTAAHLAVQAVGLHRHAGGAVAGEAQIAVQVHILPVRLAPMPHARRGQRLKLGAQTPRDRP